MTRNFPAKKNLHILHWLTLSQNLLRVPPVANFLIP